MCRANRDAFLQSAAGQYLIQFSDLSFKQQIGDGSVGRVHLGKWQVGSLLLYFCPCSCLLKYGRLPILQPLASLLFH